MAVSTPKIDDFRTDFLKSEFLDLWVTKPYKFRGFGAMEVTKPYNFIGFGAELG